MKVCQLSRGTTPVSGDPGSSKRSLGWFLLLTLVGILTIRCDNVHPHPGPVARRAVKLRDVHGHQRTNRTGSICVGCGKAFLTLRRQLEFLSTYAIKSFAN